MRSKAKRAFWDMFTELPEEVQRDARAAYRLFCENPAHTSLNFEAVNTKRTAWSVRVNSQYRVVGARRKSEWNLFVWFWIGPHNDYEKLINQLQRH